MENGLAGTQVNPCAIKQDNHLALDQAICDIDNVIGHAEELLDRIQGNISDKNDIGCDQTKPSLSSVLNNAPSEINEKASKLHDILNRISESLF